MASTKQRQLVCDKRSNSPSDSKSLGLARVSIDYVAKKIRVGLKSSERPNIPKSVGSNKKALMLADFINMQNSSYCDTSKKADSKSDLRKPHSSKLIRKGSATNIPARESKDRSGGASESKILSNSFKVEKYHLRSILKNIK